VLGPVSPPRRGYSLPQVPIREFAQLVLIGTWDELLSELAATIVPERWDYPGETDRAILREYVVVTFHRIVREDKLAVAAGGSLASFDTGLVTLEGMTSTPASCRAQVTSPGNSWASASQGKESWVCVSKRRSAGYHYQPATSRMSQPRPLPIATA